MSNPLSARKIGPHFFYKLYCFYFVAHFGSYTKASEHLNIGPSALTRMIQSLEARLKVFLLHRKARSTVRLTPEGAGVLRCSKQLVQILQNLEQSLGSLQEAMTEREPTSKNSPVFYSCGHLSELFKGLSLCFSEYSVCHDGVIQKLNQCLKKHSQDMTTLGASTSTGVSV